MENTIKFQRTYTSKKDGHKVGTVIEKNTLFEAEIKYHDTLANDMLNSDIIEEEVVVWYFDKDGNIVTPFSKKWSTPIESQAEAQTESKAE